MGMVSRGLTPGVPTPRPLVDTLPGLFQDDPMARGWTEALDALLTPVFLTLDGFPAYLDPWLAPADFLPWLAGWVGLALDPAWPPDRQRAAIAGAAELYRWRGTARGVADAVELATGVRPEVADSGWTSWSAAPAGGESPVAGGPGGNAGGGHLGGGDPGDGGDPGGGGSGGDLGGGPRLLIRLRAAGGIRPDLATARRAAALAAPAHVPVTVAIVAADGAGSTDPLDPGGAARSGEPAGS